jgi:hypothetical protein
MFGYGVGYCSVVFDFQMASYNWRILQTSDNKKLDSMEAKKNHTLGVYGWYASEHILTAV